MLLRMSIAALGQTHSPPVLGLLLAEGRAVLELGSFVAAFPWLAQLPRGDEHPVLVLPGLMAGDGSTALLRRLLKSLGYEVHGWRLGRNYGTHTDLKTGAGPAIKRRLADLAESSGGKVSLIGWSLGGLYARELARESPERVRQVITLGSPFRGNPRANNVHRIFERMSGHSIDSLESSLSDRLGEPLLVPTTAVFSRSDGIAAWGCCVQTAGPQSENIQVPGSHIGLGFNPVVAWAIADRLALPQDQWARFERSGLRKVAFGSLTG